MPLTKEELLKPRYKVIVYYPGCPWDVGRILTPIGGGNFDCKEAPTINGVTRPGLYEDVFQLLPWWSDRNPEDMPEYVTTKTIFESDNVKYYKVSEWYTYKQPIGGEEMIGFTSPDGHTIGAHAVLPIDKEEYQQAL